MKQLASLSTGTQPCVLFTKLQVAGACQVSPRTIDNWVKAKLLPSIKIGRMIRFDPEACRAAIQRFAREEVK